MSDIADLLARAKDSALIDPDGLVPELAAALLAVANAGGTCEECAKEPTCLILMTVEDEVLMATAVAFGCSLFERQP
jgi:hypothetical protein